MVLDLLWVKPNPNLLQSVPAQARPMTGLFDAKSYLGINTSNSGSDWAVFVLGWDFVKNSQFKQWEIY